MRDFSSQTCNCFLDTRYHRKHYLTSTSVFPAPTRPFYEHIHNLMSKILALEYLLLSQSLADR